jgi:hypothetical protein
MKKTITQDYRDYIHSSDVMMDSYYLKPLFAMLSFWEPEPQNPILFRTAQKSGLNPTRPVITNQN